MQDLRPALLAARPQVKLKRQRAADDVARHALGARGGQEGGAVGGAFRREDKGPEDGAAGDEELGLGEVDAGAGAAADAELVVADEGGVLGEGFAVRGKVRGQPAARVVGLRVRIEGGVAGDGLLAGVDDGALLDEVAVVDVVLLEQVRDAGRDRGPPAEALLDRGAQGGQVGRVGERGEAVAEDGVDLLAHGFLPLRVQGHGEEEGVEGPADGEDGDGAEHADGVGGFTVVKVEGGGFVGRGEPVGVAALEVGPRVAHWGGGAGRHLFFDVFDQTKPELLLGFATNADIPFGSVEPFRHAGEKGKHVGDGTGE